MMVSVVGQVTDSDCGPACVATILKLHKSKIDRVKLSQRNAPSDSFLRAAWFHIYGGQNKAEPIEWYHLKNCLRKLKLLEKHVRAIRARKPNSLPSLCIVLINYGPKKSQHGKKCGHFVVFLRKNNGEQVWLDPRSDVPRSRAPTRLFSYLPVLGT